MDRRLALIPILVFAVQTTGCVSMQQHEKLKAELDRKELLLRDAERAHRNTERKLQLAEEQIQRVNAEFKLAATAKDAADRAWLEAQQKLEEAGRSRIEDVAQVANLQVNQRTGGLILDNSLIFRPGKAELSDAGKTTIDQVAQKILSDYPGATVRVAGHTDNDPIVHSGWEDNWQLSAERARVVLLELKQQGIKAEHLYLTGHGPTVPLGERKEQNRRVEVILEGALDVGRPGG